MGSTEKERQRSKRGLMGEREDEEIVCLVSQS